MKVTHTLIAGGWAETKEKPTYPDRTNFLICCQFGDWSGFRTLRECLRQIPGNWENRSDGFYWIEER